MDIDKKATYSLIDKDENVIGEVSAIKQVENWYIGKVTDLSFPDALNEIFQEIDVLLKKKDFTAVRVLEKQIEEYEFKLKELDQVLSEFQLGKKKKKVYFKIPE